MRSTLSRWRPLRISSQSRHSERTVLTKRSAIAFAFGARTGVFTVRMPSLRKTSSKERLYLLSRSRIRKRAPCSVKSRLRLRACWVTQPPVGLVVQPASQTRRFPCAMKEHVVATQEHRLDREEIALDDARRLRSQEPAAALTGLPRCRYQPRVSE